MISLGRGICQIDRAVNPTWLPSQRDKALRVVSVYFLGGGKDGLTCYESGSLPGMRHIQSLNGLRSRCIMRIVNRKAEEGGMGYILLWLLGIPIPVLLLIFLLRGCT